MLNLAVRVDQLFWFSHKSLSNFLISSQPVYALYRRIEMWGLGKARSSVLINETLKSMTFCLGILTAWVDRRLVGILALMCMKRLLNCRDVFRVLVFFFKQLNCFATTAEDKHILFTMKCSLRVVDPKRTILPVQLPRSLFCFHCLNLLLM